MKAFRLHGPLDGEIPAVARLFELGCVGATEVAGESGPEVVAYFEHAVALPLPGVWEDVEEVDYVATYRRELKPVRAGALVIAPSHRQVTLSAGEQVLWLDPGAAFGTGHHETTRLALTALGELDLLGLRVLDVGAGSGILAIAADRMGAAAAFGVDTDAATVTVARANAIRNRSRARFLVGGLDHAELPAEFDVIVANLHAELHAELMAAYLGRLAPSGRLLLTGILTRLAATVTAALPRACRVTWRYEGDWSLLEASAPPMVDASRPPGTP